MEPNLLSPGAMSNAPDRFDGFHSFNLCCRSKADTGRNASNLRSYITDRRVFEYWSDGDWIAADRLMGIINVDFSKCPSADGGYGPSTADHIGPLSLGFMHRPEFRLLTKAANSAKNNRMSYADVLHLRKRESEGENVITWYAKPLWDLRKKDVVDGETSLRLSKLLRDNQRNAIRLLHEFLNHGYFTFLASLLNLSYADYAVIEFENLHINDYLTCFDRIYKLPRDTKYASEQKARRLRISFDALVNYGVKGNRHAFNIVNADIDSAMTKAIEVLKNQPVGIKSLDQNLFIIFFGTMTMNREEELRKISKIISRLKTDQFNEARELLYEAMSIVAQELSNMWNHERYVRDTFIFDDN